jgi:glutamate/tyrosine decarboxylase-like PLP-dependent enzyme
MSTENRYEAPGCLITDEGLQRVLRMVEEAAEGYLETIEDRPVSASDPDALLRSFEDALPDRGVGAEAAIRKLIDEGLPAATHSMGPRFFHFVVGGATPAALAADWFTSMIDQMAYAWVASPLSARLEQISIRWLLDLFAMPEHWGGVLTTGATTGNLVCLAGARQWWGEQHGIDVGNLGLVRQPPVLAAGHIHPSAIKALAILGIGRSTIQRYVADDRGSADLEAMERALRELDGAPSIMVATAGDPNAGRYDPIEAMAGLAKKYNSWLHVDGAFGLFAACSPSTAHFVQGATDARSASVDLHKWLNVPYDSGAAFVSDLRYLARAFYHEADYLPSPEDSHPNFGFLAPEMSRRARAFPIWATLFAYGRQGVRSLIERSVALAERLAANVQQAADMELLAEHQLNVVCFRYRPPGLDDEQELDELNSRVHQEILADGRVYFGSTRYAGCVGFRPAIVNWRTREEDVDLVVSVVREIGERVLGR